MGGGLMQLVAYGAQDIYLTGNPQITFFKVVYRRHTNFSMEAIQQTINGSPSNGSTSTVTISRNGDLVSKLYVTLATGSVIKGSDLVDEVELEIGGQLIDRQYQEWMNIWNELSTPESKSTGLKAMICDIGTRGTDGVGNIQVPLQFWFCRNPGLALPLIALQYHEVKLKLKWGSSHGGTTASAQVWADYIYLDTDERRRFAQVSHEYLIEQIQKQTCGGNDSNKLNFNHPVKELIWTSVATNAYGTAQLKLNGHDRFAAQEEEYFQLRQPFDCHTAIPAQNLPEAASAMRAQGIDVLTGSYSPGGDNAGIGAMAFADSAVTTLKVMVSKGVTASAAGSITGTFAVTTGQGRTAAQLAFSFLKSDFYHPPAFNDILEIQVSGTNSASGTAFSASAGGPSTTIRTKVVGVVDGAVGGITDTGNYHIMLDQLITEPTLDAAVAALTDLTIVDIRIISDNSSRTSQMVKKINVYSFALKPEEHQPSGTCNFSRIDNAKLDTTGTSLTSSENIYAVNYNVLRIMSGMGGLAYSN